MNYGGWLGWQIDYLLLLQNFRDISHHIFDKFFIFITTFGEITIPIIFVCLIYWVINKKVGQLMLWSWIGGFITNLFLKASACIYRPWLLDTRIHPLPEAMPAATGYSFPSGHTAGVMSVFGSFATSYWNNKILRYLSIFIIFSVMVSRNYLGVHTPQDVIVSFLVSCIVIFGVSKLLNWVYADKPNGKRDIILVSATFIITTLTVLYIVLKPYPIYYLFGKVLYYPHDMKYDALVKSGFAFGTFVGWLLEKRFVNFVPEYGSILKKCIRMVLGITLLYGIYSFTKVLKGLDIPFVELCSFIQYIILGLFITFIYPLIIKNYKI